MPTSAPHEYFKQYRAAMGFSSQGGAKEFLAAKNILPGIDYAYAGQLNKRIEDIIARLNIALHPDIRWDKESLASFLDENITLPFKRINENGLIPRLNNQGRRPEEVLFSWLRGFSVTNYFTPALSRLLETDLPNTPIEPSILPNRKTTQKKPNENIR